MQGQKLGGRYQLLNQPPLGSGAFGVTFLAIDTQKPGSPQCVVKQLKPQLNDPYTLAVSRRLFDREAEKLQQLGKHDQIPELMAHFEENQQFYIVQEFIEGHNLSDELTLGKQHNEAQVIKLLHDILQILAFVHQNKLIHRDIKPSNIRRRKDGKIVLIDFGAVKQVTSQVTNAQGQTNFTIAIGTPGYMPNEQANNNPQFSSDLYAVGMIGIQALTGIQPHQLKPDATTGEIAWQHHVKVSSRLANLLNKMIRSDFRQRYQSAIEALVAVNALSPSTLQRKNLLGIGVAVAAIPLTIFLLQFISQDNITYKSISRFGITIESPESWERQDEAGGDFGNAVKLLPTTEKSSNNCQLDVVVSIEDLGSKSLDEFKDFAIKKIKNNNPNIKNNIDVTTASTTLSNTSAYKLVYSRQDEQCNLQAMEIGTVKNNKAYYITYTAEAKQYSQLLPIVENMIKTFKITGTN